MLVVFHFQNYRGLNLVKGNTLLLHTLLSMHCPAEFYVIIKMFRSVRVDTKLCLICKLADRNEGRESHLLHAFPGCQQSPHICSHWTLWRLPPQWIQFVCKNYTTTTTQLIQIRILIFLFMKTKKGSHMFLLVKHKRSLCKAGINQTYYSFMCSSALWTDWRSHRPDCDSCCTPHLFIIPASPLGGDVVTAYLISLPKCPRPMASGLTVSHQPLK